MDPATADRPDVGATQGDPRGVFVCYRREDSSGHAGRLHDHLKARFRDRPIFIDVDAIRPGEDFHDRIEEAIRSSGAVLALMGPRWAGQVSGRAPVTRLDRPEDFIRIELSHALALKRPIIPVLVQGARMPTAASLPEPLRPLARLNAVVLHDVSWKSDVERLLLELERLLGSGDPARLSTTSTNLPAPPTSLIGRQRELADLTERLAGTGPRLVTITGPGGIGKTRFAMELAAHLGPSYSGGVWWVSLQSVRDAANVLPTIIQAVGARDELAIHIGDRRMLLVLDNLEQVLAVGPEIGLLLGRCPRLAVVATSREPLHIVGEQEYPLSALAEDDAVSLFAERARAIQPGFNASSAVALICERLDRLPLAIELAAARVKALSTEGLLERLDRRLPLLSGGARDMPERQRTLTATISWSYELLDEQERLLFSHLGVFEGGCTLAAAETVCGADLDRLSSLLDKSLLRRDGERYTMLETIREYAADRLMESDAAAVRMRHADWFIELAERLEPDVYGAEGARAVAVLESDHDNMRAAIRGALARGDGDSALRLAVALVPFWHEHGHVREAYAWLTQSLSVVHLRPTLLDVKALNRTAALAERLGDAANARRYWQTALQLAHDLGSERHVVIVNANLGILALADGEFAEARRGFEAAREFFASTGDDHRLATALNNLTVLALLERRLADASRLLDEGLSLARKIANHDLLSAMLHTAGIVRLAEGRLPAADSALEDALNKAMEVGDKGQIVLCVEAFAALFVAEGELVRATRLFGFADATRSSSGIADPVPRRLTEPYLARARTECGSEEFTVAWREGRSLSLDRAVSAIRARTIDAPASDSAVANSEAVAKDGATNA